jgi:hypothetical protein
MTAGRLAIASLVGSDVAFEWVDLGTVELIGRSVTSSRKKYVLYISNFRKPGERGRGDEAGL